MIKQAFIIALIFFATAMLFRTCAFGLSPIGDAPAGNHIEMSTSTHVIMDRGDALQEEQQEKLNKALQKLHDMEAARNQQIESRQDFDY